MPSLLMILTLHYTKATNYDHQIIKTTTTAKKKSLLESNKASNLLFVCPELFFFFLKKKKKSEVGFETEGVFIFCRNINVISGREQTVVDA